MTINDKEEELSPEEVQVDAIFKEYDAKIADLQNKHKSDFPGKPQPVPRPSWAKERNTTKGKMTNAEFEKSISDLVKEGKGKAVKVYEGSQPGVQAKLYEKTNQWQNPDHKGKEDKKSIDQSQSSIERLKAGGKMARDQQQIDQDTTRFGKDYAESKYDASVQHSNYYSRLGFNSTEKRDSPEPNKDDKTIEPDKD